MMKEKIKNNAKKLAVIGSGVASVGASALPVCAASGGTANQAVVDAMTTVSNDMVATGQSILPIALTVVGLLLVVVFGIKIFKSVASK